MLDDKLRNLIRLYLIIFLLKFDIIHLVIILKIKLNQVKFTLNKSDFLNLNIKPCTKIETKSKFHKKIRN